MWEPIRNGLWYAVGGRRWLLAGLALVCAMPAAAQGTNEQGTAPVIDRDRTDRLEPQIARPPLPSAQPAPSVAIAPAVPTGSQVMLTRVRYVGTSLPVAVLDAAVASYSGRPLTTETLQAVANAVGAVYAKSDIAFYAVSIPAQVAERGELTVRVVEGRISDYRLSGLSPSLPAGLIAAHMRRLMQEGPLRRSVLERTLSLLRDIPGQTVDAQIRQRATPGDLVLDLIVKRKQVQVGLLIDNSGVSNVVDGVQAQLSLTVNGLAREGDSSRLSAYLPFYPDRYQYYALSHATPIGSNGMSLTASLAHVRTRSRANGVEGEATLAGLTLNYPLVRSYKSNLAISASLDGIDSSNYFLDVRFGDYRSRALRLGASWSRSDAARGYALSAVVSQGLPILNAKPFAGFSETGFTKVNAQAVAVESLTKGLVVKATLKGQYSRDNLPVTERFSLGGRGAGMAFRVGTLTAEQAVAGSMEASWSLPGKAPLLKNSALFAYADGAIAHATSRPFYGLAARDSSLASVGSGLRLGLGPKWRVSAEVALPVKRPSATYSRRARFFFGLGRSF